MVVQEYPLPYNEPLCPDYAIMVDESYADDPDCTADQVLVELRTHVYAASFPVSLMQVERRLAYLRRKHLRRKCKEARKCGNGTAFDYNSSDEDADPYPPPHPA